MNYKEFYYSVDCNFPYHDEREWKRIIKQSVEIGGDAPFLVLHEICRVPAFEKVERPKHLDMYNYWKASFTSPIQEIIEPAAISYIAKVELSDSEALKIMDELSRFPNSYNALLVVLFSCSDEEELVDERYEEIISTWKLAT